MPGVAIPGESATAGDVWNALDGQTGQLSTANRYKAATVDTIVACEKLLQDLIDSYTAPWWQFWR